jgi:hypothetical protein
MPVARIRSKARSVRAQILTRTHRNFLLMFPGESYILYVSVAPHIIREPVEWADAARPGERARAPDIKMEQGEGCVRGRTLTRTQRPHQKGVTVPWVTASSWMVVMDVRDSMPGRDVISRAFSAYSSLSAYASANSSALPSLSACARRHPKSHSLSSRTFLRIRRL